MTIFSFDQYLHRIHYQGQPKADLATVSELMRCQLQHVPFENLDIQAGRIVSLAHDDIAEKILIQRRGGYCYEVNGLFAMALDALQVSYFYVAARPLTHGVKKPKTHMALIVTLDGEQWLCDCGYGGHGVRAPIALNSLDTRFDQDGEAYMLSRDADGEIVVNCWSHQAWEPLYSFDLTPHNWSDFNAANLYNSTHPESLFVRKLLVVLCTPHGRKVLFGNTLKVMHGDLVARTFLTAENRSTVLREEFGLEVTSENLLVT